MRPVTVRRPAVPPAPRASLGARGRFGATALVVGCLLLALPVYGAAWGAVVGPIPSLDFVANLRPGVAKPLSVGTEPFAAQWYSTGKARLAQSLGEPNITRSPWPSLIDAPVTAYDLDGDGRKEILAHSNDTHVYVFDSRTGAIVGGIRTEYPPGWYVERVLNPVAVAKLEPDDPPTVLVANAAATIAAWRFDPGRSQAGDLWFEPLWERRLDNCTADPGMDAGVAVADSDGDGTMEIFAQTEQLGLFALNADGSTRWHLCWAGGNATPLVEDLDGDNRPEAIFASDAGLVSVLDADDGTTQWAFSAGDDKYGVHPASIPVTPAVGELDGVPPKELVFTARHAPVDDPNQYASFHMAIFAVHEDPKTGQSELLWMRQPEWANPLSYTRPVIMDVDNDGKGDVFGMDWNTIGHNPGDWRVLGNANAFRLDHKGQDVWVRPVENWWSNKDIALGDSNGDGKWDVLVNSVVGGHDGVLRLSAATGKDEGFLNVPGWKMMRGPQILSLRKDNQLQLIFPMAPKDEPETRGGIALIELGVQARTPKRA